MSFFESESKAAKIEQSEMETEKIEQQGNDYSRACGGVNPIGGGQLTIFFNGSVCVYDGVTPEKAQAIMLIAAAASAVSAAANKATLAVGPAAAAAGGPAAGTAAAVAAALTRSLSQQSSSGGAAAVGSPAQQQILGAANASSLCKLQAEIPIARRHSLQQFLEKRRNRLVSKAPYASAKKSDEGTEASVEGKPMPQPQLS